MKANMLEIQNLHVSLENGEELINNISLNIKPGEIHVIMGPNGAGKSTLANVIMGHPDYEVTNGSIIFEDEEITECKTNERAKKGIFLSFQAPEEIDGITLEDFMKTAKSSISEQPVKLIPFRKELAGKMNELDFDESYGSRYLNVGFSGGEKKKSEILQMLVMNPKLAILDETDSGLDVDAVKTVSDGIKSYKNSDNSLMIISHSAKLLEDLPVDYVHVLVDGKLVYTGSKDLIKQINREGFTKFIVAEKSGA